MLHAGLLAPFLLFLSSPGLAQEPRARAHVPGALSPERTPVAQGEDALLPTVLEGFVLGPDEAPAEGAVVVSSAGGKAVTDYTGSFRLEVGVSLAAESVQVTAVGRGNKSLVATSSVSLAGASALVRVGPLLLSSVTSCSPRWLPTFGSQPGMNESVLALLVFDDGGGPALHAGGYFTTADGVTANYIAKWDGLRWSTLGSGMNGGVRALLVFDDGGGPALYAGGDFTLAGGVAANRIARWNGSSWSALGGGMNDDVRALSIFDDGSGPALHAGGYFTTAGGVAAKRIARWDGSSWSALSTGMNNRVEALLAFDDGGGPALYAGGYFTTAGGVAASRIAKWNGSSWSAVGGGMDTGSVRALSVFDDGGGPALYAGGNFQLAGGAVAFSIAKWNGSSWSALGTGLRTSVGPGAVEALLVFDDGGSSSLYVGGLFVTAGGVAAGNIAKWNGSSWSALGRGVDGYPHSSVYALSSFDDGGGPELYAGGGFTSADGLAVNRFAKWDRSSWSVVGSGLNGSVRALSVFDDGSGPVLYAGGDFTLAGGLAVNRIARWNGSNWSAVGSGMNASVHALSVFDNGGGQALYAGGTFTTAGGVAANHIATWDGWSWSALGGGMNGDVRALSIFDDGGGQALYAGGTFTTAGDVAASRIAKWNGSSWSALGGGVHGEVRAMSVFDDGGGPALYAGGLFSTAGNVAATSIAKWNGSSWSALSSGRHGPHTRRDDGFLPREVTGLDGSVGAMSVFDDGGGPALYAGGSFTNADGAAASNIAKWDGSSWSALGSGISGFVGALSVFDDGCGPALYSGGSFTIAGGVAANNIAKWDGSSWSALGSGISGFVGALSVFDDSGGPALYAGSFAVAHDSGDSFLAKWGLDVVRLDFETEDDFETLLANGQDLSSPPEFGRLLSISSGGANAGAAIFDSTPGGPNDPSQDRDLLVGRGKVLILQTDQNTTQTVPGRFDRPNDDSDGGTLRFDFHEPVCPHGLTLIDIDAGNGEATFVVLTDRADHQRVYLVPPRWTGDLLLGEPGQKTLDLQTLEPQPGFASIATASEGVGFDSEHVVRLEIELGGSGAVDDLAWQVATSL